MELKDKITFDPNNLTPEQRDELTNGREEGEADE